MLQCLNSYMPPCRMSRALASTDPSHLIHTCLPAEFHGRWPALIPATLFIHASLQNVTGAGQHWSQPPYSYMPPCRMSRALASTDPSHLIHICLPAECHGRWPALIPATLFIHAPLQNVTGAGQHWSQPPYSYMPPCRMSRALASTDPSHLIPTQFYVNLMAPNMITTAQYLSSNPR